MLCFVHILAPNSNFPLCVRTSDDSPINAETGRCVLAGGRVKPEEPKYFYFGNRELPIGILVSGRLTHKLTSSVVKVFAEEVLGYCNVSLVQMDDPTQGFDPDAQFKYISSCTDPR